MLDVIDFKSNNVIVLNLVDDVARRDHIKEHFKNIGIEKYIFFEATKSDSNYVKEYYETNMVHSYPPCFRCHKNTCNCENNILIPQQIANWISFIRIWESVSTKSGYHLICEDDVSFHKNGLDLLEQKLQLLENTTQPTLIRLSQSGLEPNLSLDINTALKITDRPVMSNAAYIINSEMAKYLVDTFEKVNMTSDVWLHGHVSKSNIVNAITLEPLIATELSYEKDYAVFASNIHPKGINKSDSLKMTNHSKRVDSIEQYNELLKSWF